MHTQTDRYTLYHGDCRTILRSMQPQSVHTCVTSPPYFGLRDYGVEGQIGLEDSPEEYVAMLVEVFREVRNVLRDDGTLWLNLGDSYAGSGKGRLFDGRHAETSKKQMSNQGTMLGRIEKSYSDDIIKPKDLMGIPWRVAFALQADGWYLRSDIVWAKPNPMPESVTDRPTKSHEYIFLLSKNKRYYYDHIAVREEAAASSIARINQPNFANQKGGPKDYRNGVNPNRSMRNTIENFAKNPGRNRRSVWTVTTKPYKGAHFATFPPDLIEPCILAGTSEYGCCSECGAPCRRVVERDQPPSVDASELDRYGNGKAGVHRKVGGQYQKWLDANPPQTIGWQATCACNADVVPCTVIDPFVGSGTTAVVALKHDRRFVGIDLNADYLGLAHDRIEKSLMQPRLLP